MQNMIEKHCSPEWRDFLRFHSVKQTFGPHQKIFDIGEETKGIYFIKKGKVKILAAGANNTLRIIRLAADGDVLGHRGFGGSWKYSIAATTLTDTEVTFIPINIFNQAVKANAELGFRMMMFFAEELRDSEKLVKQLPVKNLVASTLYANYKVFGLEPDSTRLSFTLSRKDIASKAGTTYESVVRSLADLNKSGIITIDGKSIHINDPEMLKVLSTSAV